MVLETPIEELTFIANNGCYELSTCIREIPQIVPISYIFTFFYISADYDTKNIIGIENNLFIYLVVDIYVSLFHKWGIIYGGFEVVEKDELFGYVYAIFFKLLEWVENIPCFENGYPFLKVSSVTKATWD
jgi:hypothetical protein